MLWKQRREIGGGNCRNALGEGGLSSPGSFSEVSLRKVRPSISLGGKLGFWETLAADNGACDTKEFRETAREVSRRGRSLGLERSFDEAF